MTAAWLQKAEQHLEWPRLRAAVLARCRGAGAQRRGLHMAEDRAEASALLAEMRETVGLLERGRNLPLGDVRDVEAELARLSRQGVLKASSLADILQTLDTARSLRSLLGEERSRAPSLYVACATDPALDTLESELRDALEPDGTLSDRASPELRRLRTEIANLRERIVGRMQQLIERHDTLLSDRYYTLREGRYVLPVRRDAHEQVPGIVHGTSQSGASVFVEPRVVLVHGNRLKLAESELEREEERVLAALSERVREYLPSLLAAVDAIDRIDLRHAGAQLGRELAGSVPELAATSETKLEAARHPLLALDGVAAVPNDIVVRPGQGLIISGPNASGKTVLLKTLGLAALMARHGLPIAALEGSRVAFFERVLTDVGDEQSTANNLSTFSAHISNLRLILEAADGRSLVLLDELATGTDPEEGAALACAVVDALANAGAAQVVTTHYESLKAFSLRDTRLRSASVGFDVERMEPTFTLTYDAPGPSSALLVAKRFGLPQAVLDFAERVLPEQARDFERLLATLGSHARALEQSRAEVEREQRRLEAANAEQRERLAELRRKGDAEIARQVSELQQQVKAARSELDQARARLRAEGANARELGDAQKQLASVAARVALGGDLAPPKKPPAPTEAAPRTRLSEAELRQGQRVHVARLGSDAVVVEGPTKGRVRVAVGPLKLWVESAELESTQQKLSEIAPTPERAPVPAGGRNPDNTLNVRGMRVDDALSMMESFVDRLFMGDSRVGYVLHGHGTGALRDAVRAHLKSSMPHVADSRAAPEDQGGDAVTVFYLSR